MKILPSVVVPWRALIERRHDPPVAQGRYGYRTYRSCLRWEFGFTCPFCLCHEADFASRGAEGLGITQVEHFVPVSDDEAGTNRYSNCFYICRFCNQARGVAPNVDMDGRRLLNPCGKVWAEHFVVADNDIEVRDDTDKDAQYTHAAYHLNDQRKVMRRRYRRETIEECIALLEGGGSILPRLLKKATELNEPDLVDEARLIADAIRRAWRDLEAFELSPQDAPAACACGSEKYCSIPRHLDEQAVEIEPPTPQPAS